MSASAMQGVHKYLMIYKTTYFKLTEI